MVAILLVTSGKDSANQQSGLRAAKDGLPPRKAAPKESSAEMKKATFFNVAFKFWLPDLDSNQGPAD
jgi:hypothetical protein